MPDTDSAPPCPDRGAFAEAWAHAETIPGWLTRAQAARLWDEARALGEGAHVLEIGAHQGRSTVVLAAALAAGTEHARLTTIDAFVGGDRYGGARTQAILEENLRASGVRGRVTIVAKRSRDARGAWSEPIDLLWIDGKHDYWTCSDDLRFARHLPPGRRVLVHDAFSSLGVTTSLLRHVLLGRGLRYLGRTGSLASFELAPPDRVDRMRFLRELPWWLRNLGIKVLLRLRLRSISGRFGHCDSSDPY